MRKLAVVCIGVILGFLFTGCLYAQNYIYQTGSPTFSTQIPIENGFINVNNGDIHIEIPLAAQTQRGRLQLVEKLVYDSRIWRIIDNSGYSWQPTNVPNSMGGWLFSSGVSGGTLAYQSSSGQILCVAGQPIYGHYLYNQYRTWTWTDPRGTSHTFYVSTMQYTADTKPPCSTMPSSTPTASGDAADGSGYQIQISNYTNAVIYDSTGTVYHPTLSGVSQPSGTPLVVDSNGNYFSEDTSGNLVDTLARTPVLVSTSGNQTYYDVLTYGGNRSRYTVTTETVYYNTNFQETGVSESSGSFTAIQSIGLPDGSSYSFTYDSGTSSGNYGELTSVTLPTGGVIQYAYTNFLDSFQNKNRWVHTRVKDGGTTTLAPATISNCNSNSGCEEKTTVTSPTGNDTVYTFTLDPGDLANGGSWVTNIDAYQGAASSGTKLRSTNTNYTYIPYYYTVYTTSNGTTTSTQDTYHVPGTVVTVSTLPDVGLSTKSETDLACLGACTTATKQWDYYSGTAPSSPTTETDYTYYSGLSYPTQVSTKDGSGNLIAQTTYSYDQTTPTPTSGLPGHTSASGTRANLTTLAQWINTSGSTLNTTMAYDDAGALLSSTDPNGTTSYGHDSTDTFVTSTTPPTPSSEVVLTSYATYDQSTGLLSSTTDPNSQTTNYKFYDEFGRPTEIDFPDNGVTKFIYTSTQLSEHDYQYSGVYADKETLYDSYGRLSRVALYNGQAPSQDWYQTDTCYNAVGQVSFRSYSYQGTGFAQAKVCSGSGDTYAYDALGRTTSITHSDGTAMSYSYAGRASETKDEHGVTKIAQYDGLGRLTEACEISSNSTMPSSGSPASCGTDIAGTGFATNYTYGDLANHKATITQGGQSRVFQSDSIGRTILAQEPESGQTTYSYTYNSTGLQVLRTRPEANQSNPSVTTTTTTQYDTVGRPLSVTYSDGTPNKSYAYDVGQEWGVTLQNPKGRLVMQSTANTGTIYGYDPIGRIALMDERTPSNAQDNTSYFYDWLGNLTQGTDPLRGWNQYTYSVANEVLSLTSQVSDSNHPPNLVSNVQNGPDGPLNWNLGNGLTGVRQYDAMGRVSGGWVCNGSTQPSCSGGTQVYGFTDAWTGDYLTARCDTVVNNCSNYGYDDFGRLSSATVTQGQSDNFTYVYDRWGNRWNQNVTGGVGPSPQLSFNTSNNEITSAGYVYDAAGNLISDGTYTYTYDADGNVTNVAQGGTTLDTYTYNASNQRVRIDPGPNGPVEFFFNPEGQHTSSYAVRYGWEDTGWNYWGASPAVFYANGAANFDHQDWMGTERMRTTYNGQVQGSYVSLPFGDGYAATGADLDPYHFAGLDYDSDSDTDHAQYRQYSPTAGRWMSPDPYDGSYDPSNPQTFNRYSYVVNNPFAYTDTSGLEEQGDNGGNDSDPCPYACVPIPGVGGGGDPLSNLFSFLFGGPSFHGSLKPRPNAQPWDEYHIHYGPDIAGALGLPDEQCEFGACTNTGAMNAAPGSGNSAPAISVLPYQTYQDILAMRQAFDAGVSALNSKGRLATSGKIGGSINNFWQCARGVAGQPMYGCGGQAAYMYGQMEGLHLNESWTFEYVYQWSFLHPIPHQYIQATSPGNPSVTIDPWLNLFQVNY